MQHQYGGPDFFRIREVIASFRVYLHVWCYNCLYKSSLEANCNVQLKPTAMCSRNHWFSLKKVVLKQITFLAVKMVRGKRAQVFQHSEQLLIMGKGVLLSFMSER